MTQFNISFEKGVDLSVFAVEHAISREIFAKTKPSYRIMDAAEAVTPGAKTKIVCIRPRKQMHEAIINRSEPLNTIDLGIYYTILPRENNTFSSSYNSKEETMGAPSFCYNNDTNDKGLSIKVKTI